MAKVFIGVDPHRLSATIEVVDERETVLATGRFGTDKAGYAAMRKHVASYPQRVWAVEGSNGTGRPLAQRLLADGEHVVDVPAKLSARARLFDTGHNRKTDAHDAHAVAVVAVRTKTLRVLSYDAELEVLRMLVDRRDELTKAKVQAVNRLQRLLSELVPGQSKKDITALQAKKILAGVRPRDLAGKTRKRLAAGAARRDGRHRGEDQSLHQGAEDPGPGPRLHPDGPDRRRAGRRRAGSSPTSVTSPGSLTATGSPPGPAPHPWTPPPVSRSATASPEPGTARPTTSSTSPPPARSASTPPAGPTTGASSPPARPPWRRCAA